MMNLQGLKSHGRLGVVLSVLLAMLLGTPAAAFQFSLGEVNGSLDSTLSYGLSWRLDDQDQSIIGIAEGGKAYSVNYDDGNLNYDKGDLISNTTKLTSELALDYQNFGIFVRGTAFYDFENEEGERARASTPLRSEALDLVGSDIELLDAYAWWNFEADDKPGQIRVGDQVLSWGESTFIRNGINVINPFDIGKLRLPGAELKEGLVPVGMVSASFSPTDNLTFEAFYQYDWEEVKIDPPGSYWSTNDFVGEGGNKVMLGWGGIPDMGNLPAEDTLLGIPRAPNVYADDDGQYGLAMRVYAPGLNDTEFGFFYMNYHSRVPVISSQTGTVTGLKRASGINAGATDYFGGATVLAASTTAVAASELVSGVPATATLTMTEALTTIGTVDFVATNVSPATAADLAGAYVRDFYGKTAGYQIEYPEDIQLFGVSFNTVLPDSGVALQGEVSYRKDTPLQVDDIELLLATMEPLGIASAWAGGSFLTELPGYSQYPTSVLPTDLGLNTGVYLPGYKLLDVSQAQVTATKLFGPTFGADQFVMVGEVGATFVHDMPSKDELRFNGPGTPVTGNPLHSLPTTIYPFAAHSGIPYETSTAFADATSWGYRMVGKLDFNDAIGAVTLSPRIAWSHDVNGTTPGPGGNFIDGRKAITFGLGASYQNTWSADLSYTDFFGASRYNLVNDRDFVALNIKYSF
jgi:hypothetical protein